MLTNKHLINEMVSDKQVARLIKNGIVIEETLYDSTDLLINVKHFGTAYIVTEFTKYLGL